MMPSDPSHLSFLHQSESRRLEFKSSFPKGDRVASTVIAFANGAGGRLVFGIKDTPRQILGIPEEGLFALEEKIANHIFDLCAPTIVPEIYIQSVEGKLLLVVQIFPGSHKPYYLKKEGKHKGTIIRIGSSNRKASLEMIEELERQRRKVSFDSLPAYECSMESLDLKVFKADYKALAGKSIEGSHLKNLGLIICERDQRYPANAAVLLSESIARKKIFPYAKIECARFKGTDTRVFIDQTTIEGPVHAAVEPCMAFIKKNIALASTIGEIYRKDRWEYPLEAVREALLNAIVHRDYSILGSDIKVAIFDDMLEITSPGPLPDTLPPEKLGSGRSEIRNRVLAPIFKDLKLIEAWGSGILKMKKELDGYPEIRLVLQEAGHAFQVQFVKTNHKKGASGQRQDLEKAASQPESQPESAPNRYQAGTKQAPSRHQVGTKLSMSNEQANLLKKCKKPQSLLNLLKFSNRSDRTKFKKGVINPLQVAGYLEMTEPDRPQSPTQKYRTTAKGRELLETIDFE